MVSAAAPRDEAGPAASRKLPSFASSRDRVRTAAGHFLSYDDLSRRGDGAARHHLRGVARATFKRNQNCLQLPMSLAYFVCWVSSVWFHEDISQVFFFEYKLCKKMDSMFEPVNSIDQFWNATLNEFVPFFFAQTDMYGDNLTKSFGGDDSWGNWGRVELYSQIQGAVVLDQWRSSDAHSHGVAHTGEYNSAAFELQASGEGFHRRLGEADWSPRAESAAGEERRLRKFSWPLRSSLPPGRKEEASALLPAAPGDQASNRIWLYPAEEQERTLDRLRYFQERQWVDTGTEHVQIRLSLLNAELGRPRLENLQADFFFDQAGGVHYRCNMEPVFLEMWQNLFSLGWDFLFVCMVLLASWLRLRAIWVAFRQARFLDHLGNTFTLWELFLVAAGWFNLYYLHWIMTLQDQTRERLERVRASGWSTNNLEELSVATSDFFAATNHSVLVLGAWRILACWYTISLMLRFFFSFGSQPRLALFTRTMAVAKTDLLHFLVVLAPVVLAYVICGNLLFGRRMEEFATVQSSVATVFRITMESEYPWGEMAQENYWTAGMFIWSFCCLVVLLMLNMLVAVVLDLYGEVREASSASEPIWETLYAFLARLIHMRYWIPYKDLDEALATQVKSSVVTREELLALYPNIPEIQVEMLFVAARKWADHEASRLVNGKGLLQLMGSMMHEVSRVKAHVSSMKSEAAPSLVQKWTQGEVQSLFASSIHEENFLTVPFVAKSYKDEGVWMPMLPEAVEGGGATGGDGVSFGSRSSSSSSGFSSAARAALPRNKARDPGPHPQATLLGAAQASEPPAPPPMVAEASHRGRPLAEFMHAPDVPNYMGEVAVILETRRHCLTQLVDQVTKMQIKLHAALQKEQRDRPGGGIL